MLKGRINIYDFVLNMNGDIDEISTKLKEIFYGKISCITIKCKKNIKEKL